MQVQSVSNSVSTVSEVSQVSQGVRQVAIVYLYCINRDSGDCRIPPAWAVSHSPVDSVSGASVIPLIREIVSQMPDLGVSCVASCVSR